MKISVFLRAFLLSLALHLALGATSYALLHLVDYSTAYKLPTGRLLTVEVAFESVKSALSISDSIVDQKDGDMVIHSPSPPITKKVSIGKAVSKRNHADKGQTKDEVSVDDRQSAGSSLPKPYQKLPLDQPIRVNYPEEERMQGKEALCIINIHIVHGKIQALHLSDTSHNCLASFQREAFIAISEKLFSHLSKDSAYYMMPIHFRLED